MSKSNLPDKMTLAADMLGTEEGREILLNEFKYGLKDSIGLSILKDVLAELTASYVDDTFYDGTRTADPNRQGRVLQDLVAKDQSRCRATSLILLGQFLQWMEEGLIFDIESGVCTGELGKTMIEKGYDE